jgi:hypothetical protein
LTEFSRFLRGINPRKWIAGAVCVLTQELIRLQIILFAILQQSGVFAQRLQRFSGDSID